MAQNIQNAAELSALIESIVAKVLNQSGGSLASWESRNARISSQLSYANQRDWGNGGQIAGQAYTIGRVASYIADNPTKFFGSPATQKSTQAVGSSATQESTKRLGEFGAGVMSVAGIASAYESGDALSGALSGAYFGWAGAAVGLLAGLLSPGVDRWQRPKFKDAPKAFDRMFTTDRGERDQYYMPDSFYFRTGQTGTKSLVVNIGNDQFDNHIRDSMTNNYASQLQRGLVDYT